MKLLDKYNRISLIMTIVVMMITGIVYYYTISEILTRQVDKSLRDEEHEIINYARLNHTLPQVFQSNDLQTYFTHTGSQISVRRYVDTSFYNKKERERELGRGLISTVIVNGQTYQVTLIESKVETEYLIRIIFMITLGLIVFIILTLFIINRLAIKKLWQPFYQTLNQVKLFNLTDKNIITPSTSEIEEFRELNRSVSAMEQRVINDYQELKSFMENASHELMTPIAVINSKLDTLIQTENLTERQAELLSDVYETVSKLTRLNRAMLLLTKIENKLINDDQVINIKYAVEECLSQFHELFISKEISVTTKLNGDVSLIISKSLFEVLLNNLISNALRHNYAGGKIDIEVLQKGLVIKNTGPLTPLDRARIFSRFIKSPESEGSGLGLTLSRQICENYQLKLDYAYQDDLHIFSVSFI